MIASILTPDFKVNVHELPLETPDGNVAVTSLSLRQDALTV